MDVREAIRYILDGDAVLFVGAGFSRAAINAYSGEGMKTASELSKELCNEMGIPEKEDLSKVSNYYLRDKRDKEYHARAQKLIKKLQDYFICKEVSDSQKIVTQNNWIRIYTTNYDDVLEVAGSGNSQYERTPMTMKDNVNDIVSANSVIHLNGFIRNLDKDHLEDDFKLTTRSYLVQSFKESDVSGLFYEDLKEARAVVFIGTSLDYDFELQQILYSDEYKEKIIFIDKESKREEIDVVEEQTKKMLGSVFYIGLDGFAKELEEFSKTYRANTSFMEFRSFEKIERKNYALKEGKLINTWNLFASGNLDREIVFSHVGDDTYVIRRSVAADICDNIDKRKRTVNIIHSNLGNGKTCLMEYLMCFLSGKYHVFNFLEQFNDISKELKAIQVMEGPKVIFVEEYNLYLKMISNLKYYWDESWHLVLSCRTYINDHSLYKLCSALRIQEDSVSEFDINYFTDTEKPKIVATIKNINLAEIKDLGFNKALRLLEERGKNCWADTVMYMFSNEQIKVRIDDIYEKIIRNNSISEFIIAAMVNNIVGMNLSYNQILLIMQIQQYNLSWTHDENVAEILTMQKEKVEIKSSLLSLYLIRSKNMYSEVIKVMKKMILHSNLLLGDASEMVKRLLISTSNISELFYKSVPNLQTNPVDIELRSELLDYFGDICKVKYYERNEFFWLQYAMACMDMKEYSLAENNFNLAHKYEKEKNIESYQIKVQYGRFLLQRANDSGMEEEPFKVFQKVNSEWKKVLLNDQAQRYYVYKQMDQYKKFIQLYSHQFSESEYNKAARMVDEMIGLVNKRDKRNARRMDRAQVTELLRESKDIMFRAIVRI